MDTQLSHSVPTQLVIFGIRDGGGGGARSGLGFQLRVRGKNPRAGFGIARTRRQSPGKISFGERHWMYCRTFTVRVKSLFGEVFDYLSI